MKKLFLLGSIFVSSLGFAWTGDGCFLMYKNASIYPVFCLVGTEEEGIGGSNAKLVLFETNSDAPTNCSKTSSLSVDSTKKSLAIEVDDKLEMTLFYKSPKSQKPRRGIVVVGHSEFNFEELSESRTEKFMSNIYSSEICN